MPRAVRAGAATCLVSAGLASEAPAAEPLVDETVNGVAADEGAGLAIARGARAWRQAVPGGSPVRLITCVRRGILWGSNPPRGQQVQPRPTAKPHLDPKSSGDELAGPTLTGAPAKRVPRDARIFLCSIHNRYDDDNRPLHRSGYRDHCCCMHCQSSCLDISDGMRSMSRQR